MKRDGLLQRVPRITTTVLVAVVLLACATVVNAAAEKQDDRWHFTIPPFIWLPSISGSMKLEPPPALEAGKVDMVLSGMTIVPARNLRVAFVGPYFASGKSILTKKANVESVNEIAKMNNPEKVLVAH